MSALHRLATLASLVLAGAALSCTDSPLEPVPEPSGNGVAVDLQPALIDPSSPVRISELHYDDAGTDTGERIELEAAAGFDLSGWEVVLYNGSNGSVYDTRSLAGTVPATCGAEGVTVLDYPTNGIQNGSPDGIALVDPSGTVREFLSYEGTLTGAGGPADGLTSTDIGASESSGTPEGFSLQRQGDGTWSAGPNSFGACNTGDGGGGAGGGGGSDIFVSELHYDNAGGDENEAFEVSGPAGASLDGWRIVLYNGNGGASYGEIALSGALPDCGPGRGLVFPFSGVQNGSPDGFALVDPSGTVVEFLSYEGTVDATDGPAAGLTSTDIGVAEGSGTGADESLQRDTPAGPWTGPAPSTFGCDAPPPPPEPGVQLFLSEVRTDQPGGDDDEYVEIAGPAGASLTGVTFVVVGDGPGGAGVIEEVLDLTGQSLSGDGAFVAAESSFSLGSADLITSLAFENGDNPTFFLVRGFTGSDGQDLDTDDDGVFETTPWSEVVDCLSLIEFLGLQPIYCDQRLGRDVSFTPGHSKRTTDGWISAIFTPGIDDTPGVVEFDVASAAPGVLAPWGVAPPGVPTRISVSASFVPLPVGYDRALFVTVRDDFNDEVPGFTPTFTSSNPGVATADAFGNLSANGVGEAVLTVAAGDLASTEVSIDVVPDVPSGVTFQDHVEFGAPSDHDPSDDLVVTRDEYVASYNPARNASNWVAWNLDAEHIGDVDRCECYTFDPALNAFGAAEVVNFDYTGSGYSRGHMTQSFNRTATLPDNAATYLLTNILPQSSANNGGPWGDFEFYTNGRVFDGEEAYLVAGGIWGANPSTLKNEGKVQIPDYTWKVAVFVRGDGTLADVTSRDDLEVIAIVTPNRIESGVPGGVDELVSDDWRDYVVEVDELEARTGYDVLSLLPDKIENVLESGFDDLVTLFDTSVDTGRLRRGSAKLLEVKLRLAERFVARGWNRLARLKLELFGRQLERLARRDRIAPSVVDALVDEVERVQAVLAAGG
jgi:DNA/RNA endonuclease G (NUC1)